MFLKIVILSLSHDLKFAIKNGLIFFGKLEKKQSFETNNNGGPGLLIPFTVSKNSEKKQPTITS